MRRKELMLKLAQTLVRRRSALCRTLAGNASLIAPVERPVGDVIDAAADCDQDELDSQLVAVESRELAAIDAALDRIRAGRYGICENCEKPIPATRLQALPYATLCIQCQREEEQPGRGQTPAFHWERVIDESFDEEPNHSNGLEVEFA
jgi:DnaK suppressor protein